MTSLRGTPPPARLFSPALDDRRMSSGPLGFDNGDDGDDDDDDGDDDDEECGDDDGQDGDSEKYRLESILGP